MAVAVTSAPSTLALAPEGAVRVSSCHCSYFAFALPLEILFVKIHSVGAMFSSCYRRGSLSSASAYYYAAQTISSLYGRGTRVGVTAIAVFVLCSEYDAPMHFLLQNKLTLPFACESCLEIKAPQ